MSFSFDAFIIYIYSLNKQKILFIFGISKKNFLVPKKSMPKSGTSKN
jgi:hypothetical protein